ncbi:MAG: hypothetical protein QOH78_653, partial [Verrucomicrobiota bacterium]
MPIVRQTFLPGQTRSVLFSSNGVDFVLRSHTLFFIDDETLRGIVGARYLARRAT